MYQVLYRKWRPQTFSDVYGQPAITTALKNELRTGRLAHAYLFTGSRGTGKTSCAKILAKAVNCLDPRDGDPCNECEICRGIDDGAVMDVVEIDAASNNGVDSIRDLREEVNFTPSVAQYRVYIIDEVHMLSTGAFNALLKTLEEPPAHVIFVLATTEVHKLPATILSRCQRFDFGRIAPEDIAARIAYIAGQEEFTVTDDAALLIARLADGGMRDALSLLDQCVSRSREVTEDTVVEATGMAGREYLFELSEAVRTGNGGAALTLIGRLHGASRDMERLCTELIDFYRSLMVIKSVPDPRGLIVAPPAELARLREEAALYELPAVLHCMEGLQDALERLRSGASRRVEMEMALLRLCAPDLDSGTAALLRRVKALEDRMKSGRVPAVPVADAPMGPAIPGTPDSSAEGPALPFERPAVPAKGPETAPLPDEPTSPPETLAETHSSAEPPIKPAAVPTRAVPPAGLEVEPEGPGETPFSRWNDVLETLSATCPPMYGVLLGSTAVLRGDYVLIETDNELFKSLVGRDGNKTILAEAIRGVTGRAHRIGIKKKSAAPAGNAADPLADFIRSSRELGVAVEVK